MDIDLIELNKWKKRGIAFLSDTAVTLFSWLAASWLTANLTLMNTENLFFLVAITLMQCGTYILFGLYRGVWRFASIPDLMRILRAIVVGSLLNILFLEWNHIHPSIKTYIINALLLIILLSGPRLLFRWLRDYRHLFSPSKRILVVGAGSAGEGILRDLRRSASVYHYLPVAIVDDNPNRHGFEVQGVRVLGSCKDIPKLVKKHRIELILLAIPSANSTRMRTIVQYCEEANTPFRTLPSLKNIADGNVTVHSLRDVSLEDLLGREEVDLDWQAIQNSITDKIILVTGGGGSIGSELCRQIHSLHPKQLIIVDNNEFNLYSIEMELSKKMTRDQLQAHLCNVTDKIEMQKIFNLYQPHLVFHVAAYKHVPLLETHLRVSMQNNILGTRTVAELSEQYAVNTFVLISTDKAVNPTSVMGATKRAAELFCQIFNLYSSTRFITVRFGNVLDSAGSVIPLFRQQLLKGGPLTVTHRDISRYFMTIPEASQLILQATTMQQEGDIFVLDMGDPIKINYLAEQMIRLSGKVIGEDIKIEYIGLRPGEKLYEELFHHEESISKTTHPKIRQAKIRNFDWPLLLHFISEIEIACYECNEMKLIELLYKLVPEYKIYQQSHKPLEVIFDDAKKAPIRVSNFELAT